MKRLYILFVGLGLIYSLPSMAQSTLLEVYDIVKTNCAGCHDNTDPAGGLDLLGIGATDAAKALDVYNNLVWQSPSNNAAANEGLLRVYPGRPDLSYMFHKVNQGLEPTITLGSGMGDPMPQTGDPLKDEDKEMIRQWILFGAPSSGIVVDDQLIDNFYNLNGAAAFPDGPPASPPVGDGFQIKMGPFYMEPNGEVEYFQKWELDLPEDVDVDRIEVLISGYSHHFILYDFQGSGSQTLPHGLRLNSFHSNDIGLVAAVQEATDLVLPNGTAFQWENDRVLDLNVHYINYSANETYQAEAYLNIYTKPAGTAAQKMETALFANFDIFIPNNGNTYTFDQVINYPIGDIFLWGLMGHTHQWGTSYKIYQRENGQKGDLLYDASCPAGIPGCVSPYFDYQHIPMRYFDPLFPTYMGAGPNGGFIHEASWENFGPFPVGFGPTSNDEMMVAIAMYVTDTTGLNIPTSVQPLNPTLGELGNIYPNPAFNILYVEWPSRVGFHDAYLTNSLGQIISCRVHQTGDLLRVERPEGLRTGLYGLVVKDQEGKVFVGKVTFD